MFSNLVKGIVTFVYETIIPFSQAVIDLFTSEINGTIADALGISGVTIVEVMFGAMLGVYITKALVNFFV